MTAPTVKLQLLRGLLFGLMLLGVLALAGVVLVLAGCAPAPAHPPAGPTEAEQLAEASAEHQRREAWHAQQAADAAVHNEALKPRVFSPTPTERMPFCATTTTESRKGREPGQAPLIIVYRDQECYETREECVARLVQSGMDPSSPGTFPVEPGWCDRTPAIAR